jgi:ABC-type glutathione transport system ATPase component
MVGDGHAVSVATQVTEYLPGSAESRLGIDHPIVPMEAAQQLTILPGHFPPKPQTSMIDYSRAGIGRAIPKPLSASARISELEVSLELRIENLSKTYPNGVKALDNVTLDIPHGMYGLLGPNGAGKTTLMRTIATLQEPDSGSIRLSEIDVLRQKDEVRRALTQNIEHEKVAALLDPFAIRT